MFPKGRVRLAQLETPNPDGPGFATLWIQGIGSLIAVAGAIVAVKAARLSPFWVTLLLALAVLMVLGLAVPLLARVGRAWWTRRVLAWALRDSWKSFRHEVDERRWLFTHQHTHSLVTLLGALHSNPQDMGGQVRLHALRTAVSACAALDRMRVRLDLLVDDHWRGESPARATIGLFEELLSFPDSVGWVRELSALEQEERDGRLVGEWLTRYRETVSEYGRWARDQNRQLGEKVFREYFM